MIDPLLSTDTLNLVQRGLDASALAHSVIANNIANVDTPGFKRSAVDFGSQLQQAMSARANAADELSMVRTDPRDFGGDPAVALGDVKPSVVTDRSTSLRNDGNNVDIDKEVALLAENTIRYQSLAQILQHEYAEMMDAITDNTK